MISLKEFIKKHSGELVDVPWGNGSLKGQCVSLVQIYLNECYGIELKPRGHGNAYCQSIVNAGLGYYVDSPQRGDIINYDTPGDWNPYGHVAIVTSPSEVFEQWAERGAHYGNINQSQKRLYVVRLYGNRPADNPEPSLTDREIAEQILYGNNIWGNGEERKKNLGSRYNSVQAIINEILYGKKPNKTAREFALEVWYEGKHGNGQARRDSANALGVDYNEAQRLINILANGGKI